MKINGIEKEYAEGVSLTEVLQKEGYQLVQIAVERNEEIVPRAEYDTMLLKSDDCLEIVRFVGGG